MALLMLAAFIAVPLAEIALFIEVGGVIGLWPTLAIVVLTALVGTALLRAQGLATFARAQAALARGDLPMQEVMHGFFLVIAGALLLTPGFLTDAVGMALFVPAVRSALGRAIRRAALAHAEVRVYTTGAQPQPDRQGEKPGPIIEGEAEVEAPPPDDTESPPRRPDPGEPSPWKQ